MGPSFNDFGSFSSGGSAAGGFGIGGGAGSVGGNGTTSGAGSVGGAANGAIVSGPGDIRLASSRGGRKKWLVAVVMTMVVVGLVALVIFVVMSKGRLGDNGDSGLVSAYNVYANYVLLGRDSGENLNMDIIASSTPYFESLPVNERSEYLSHANEKYEKLLDICYVEKCNFDLNKLAVYFQGFAGIAPLDEGELFEKYVNDGEVSTIEYIYNYYKTDYHDEKMDSYIDSLERAALLEVDYIREAVDSGCYDAENKAIVCANVINKHASGIIDAELSADSYVWRMESDALNVLYGMYDVVYDNEWSGQNV